MIKVQQSGDQVTFAVRVHPKARRERIAGMVGDRIKIEVTAAPIEGKANRACISFFSELLKVPRSSVTIAAGINSRNKVIRVTGVSAGAVEQTLALALSTWNEH